MRVSDHVALHVAPVSTGRGTIHGGVAEVAYFNGAKIRWPRPLAVCCTMQEMGARTAHAELEASNTIGWRLAS